MSRRRSGGLFLFGMLLQPSTGSISVMWFYLSFRLPSPPRASARALKISESWFCVQMQLCVRFLPSSSKTLERLSEKILESWVMKIMG